MLRTLMLVLFTLTLPVSASEQWSKVSDNGFTSFFVDFNTVKKSGSSRTFWMVMNYPANAMSDGSLSQRTKEIIDCDKETVQVLTRTYFTESSARGFPLSTIDPPLKWEHIVPRSPIADVMKAVCR